MIIFEWGAFLKNVVYYLEGGFDEGVLIKSILLLYKHPRK